MTKKLASKFDNRTKKTVTKTMTKKHKHLPLEVNLDESKEPKSSASECV